MHSQLLNPLLTWPIIYVSEKPIGYLHDIWTEAHYELHGLEIFYVEKVTIWLIRLILLTAEMKTPKGCG